MTCCAFHGVYRRPRSPCGIHATASHQTIYRNRQEDGSAAHTQCLELCVSGRAKKRVTKHGNNLGRAHTRHPQVSWRKTPTALVYFDFSCGYTARQFMTLRHSAHTFGNNARVRRKYRYSARAPERKGPTQGPQLWHRLHRNVTTPDHPAYTTQQIHVDHQNRQDGRGKAHDGEIVNCGCGKRSRELKEHQREKK